MLALAAVQSGRIVWGVIVILFGVISFVLRNRRARPVNPTLSIVVLVVALAIGIADIATAL